MPERPLPSGRLDTQVVGRAPRSFDARQGRRYRRPASAVVPTHERRSEGPAQEEVAFSGWVVRHRLKCADNPTQRLQVTRKVPAPCEGYGSDGRQAARIAATRCVHLHR
jgi:hypothetical protein